MDSYVWIFCVPKHLSKHPHVFLDQIVKELFALAEHLVDAPCCARAAYSNDLLPWVNLNFHVFFRRFKLLNFLQKLPTQPVALWPPLEESAHSIDGSFSVNAFFKKKYFLFFGASIQVKCAPQRRWTNDLNQQTTGSSFYQSEPDGISHI